MMVLGTPLWFALLLVFVLMGLAVMFFRDDLMKKKRKSTKRHSGPRCPACGSPYKTRALYYRGNTYYIKECPECSRKKARQPTRKSPTGCTHPTKQLRDGQYVCAECGEILERS